MVTFQSAGVVMAPTADARANLLSRTQCRSSTIFASLPTKAVSTKSRKPLKSP